MTRAAAIGPLFALLVSVAFSAPAAAANDRLELEPRHTALAEVDRTDTTPAPRGSAGLCGERPCLAALEPRLLQSLTHIASDGHRLMVRMLDRDLTSRVEVITSDGTQTCEVFSRQRPCILRVPAGTATIRTIGDIDVEEEVQITPGENIARVSRDTGSRNGVIAGGVMLAVGLGVGIPTLANDCLDDAFEEVGCTLAVMGSGMATGFGILYLAIGVPMMLLGSDNFSFEQGSGGYGRAAPERSPVIPRLAVGYSARDERKSVSATWQF